MLRITIELVPFGIEGAKRVINAGTICNDGTGTHKHGSYVCILDGVKCKVKHLREQSAWVLLKKAIEAIEKAQNEQAKAAQRADQ